VELNNLAAKFGGQNLKKDEWIISFSHKNNINIENYNAIFSSTPSLSSEI